MNQEDALIKRLPEELMIRVFELLNGECLKECSLVCQQWNEIIGQSSAVMKKLPLRLAKKRIPDSQELVRKYHTIKCKIEISELSKDFRNLERLLSQQGRNLRMLEFEGCTFALTATNLLNKTFESLTQLETLKFGDSHFVIEDNIAASRVVEPKGRFCKILKLQILPRLKSVVLRESDLNLLRFIETTQIASLNIDGVKNLTKEALNSLTGFLVAQSELEEFAFRCFERPNSKVDIEKLKKINFPLKKLSIFNLEHFLETEENILMFLGKFANTLEELELYDLSLDSAIEMIFKKFLKLKTLHIYLDEELPTDEAFYRNLRPNPSVRKLIVRGSPIKFPSAFQGFIGNLPSVKELIVKQKLSREQMKFIANNLNLKSLQLGFVPKHSFNGIFMPSVQFLSIRVLEISLMRQNSWKAFISTMPNVETFSAKEIKVYDLLHDFFSIFSKKWRRLRHIKLGRGFLVDREDFNFHDILNNCHNLRIVEIDESAFDCSFMEKECIFCKSRPCGGCLSLDKEALESELSGTLKVLRDFNSSDSSLIIHSKDEKWRSKEWKLGMWEDDVDVEEDSQEETSEIGFDNKMEFMLRELDL